MPLVTFGHAAIDAVGEARAALVAKAPAHGASPPPHKKWSEDKTLALVKKWSPIFGVPPETIMSIVAIESEHDPNKVNPAREDKGGAWGLGQQMLDEADEKIHKIRATFGKQHPEIKVTAKRWRGDPSNLLDPDLNLMITAWQLGQLHKAFGGDFATVAAAYHQGQHAVQSRLAKGLPAVSKSQPKGMQYVAMAEAAHKKYEPVRPTPAMYYE